MKGQVVVLILALCLAPVVHQLYHGMFLRFRLGDADTLQPTEHQCVRMGEALGVEDLLVLDQQTVLGTHLDGLTLWLLPSRTNPSRADPTAAQAGSIWALSFCADSGEPRSLEPARMLGRPEGVAFHPHSFG